MFVSLYVSAQFFLLYFISMIKLHIPFLFIVILRIELRVFSMLSEVSTTQLIIQLYIYLCLCNKVKGSLSVITLHLLYSYLLLAVLLLINQVFVSFPLGTELI